MASTSCMSSCVSGMPGCTPVFHPLAPFGYTPMKGVEPWTYDCQEAPYPQFVPPEPWNTKMMGQLVDAPAQPVGTSTRTWHSLRDEYGVWSQTPVRSLGAPAVLATRDVPMLALPGQALGGAPGELGALGAIEAMAAVFMHPVTQ